MLLTRAELANSSLTGRQSNAFKDVAVNEKLNENKVKAVQQNYAAVQFQVPALDAKTQIQISVSDVAMQTEYHSRLDNFGLPPGLTLATVLRATRQRGANLEWILDSLRD